MHILLLTQGYDPEPNPKGQNFARELVKNGAKVTVITGFPNYPGGKVYPGYKIKPIQIEYIEGIEIHRVAIYPSHGSSKIGRIFNYLSFFFSSTFYVIFFLKKIDIIYAYHPPITVGISSIILKFFKRSKVVLDIQDIWPDTLKSTGMINNKSILSFISFICKVVYKYVDAITVLSPGFKEKLINTNVPKDKINIIYNWTNEGELKFIKKRNIVSENSSFRVIFAGNMGPAQALESVISSAEYISKKNNDIEFVFIGNGIEKKSLQKIVKDKNISNVIFKDYIPITKIGNVLSSADALLVHLKKDELFRITIPSKIQAYMFSDKPIILGVEGDGADLILKSKCGITVEPENYLSITVGILRLYNMTSKDRYEMGKNGKKYYLNNMSLEIGTKKYFQLFKSL